MTLGSSRPSTGTAAVRGGWDAVRMALGALWLLDGALQCQPYMFSRDFATKVLASSGAGQPPWVAVGVSWSAHLVATFPVAAGFGFAGAQLLLGVAIFHRPTAVLGLYASIAWALGVWYFGEGLGGVATGGNMLVGFPGPALLYAVIAVILITSVAPSGRGWLVARWAWLCVWCAGGAVALAGGQYLPGAQRALFAVSAAGAPSFLSPATRAVGHFFASGWVPGTVLASLELAVGLSALGPARVRLAAACAGAVLALFIWSFGQDLGQLWTGSATDPGSGPPLVLMAFALAWAAVRSRRSEVAGARTVASTSPDGTAVPFPARSAA